VYIYCRVLSIIIIIIIKTIMYAHTRIGNDAILNTPFQVVDSYI